MWYLFQSAVFMAVMWTDWTWHWGDRSYAPMLLGAFAAFIASAIVQGILNLINGLPFRGIDERSGEHPKNALGYAREWLWR